jgi:serine/threonine protein kinase
VIQLGAHSGQADLERLQDALDPPSRIAAYQLSGLVARTETALVYVASGGVFADEEEGILKLTSRDYAPLLERELAILVRCEQAEVDGVIRPRNAAALRLRMGRSAGLTAVAVALPFCSGGNLVNVIAGRSSHGLGSGFALDVGAYVGSALRGLLALPHPVVHGDVRPENVLLPSPESDLAQLTLIDFDAARELTTALPGVVSDRESASALAGDVRGFGELLYQSATGSELPDRAKLSTGNPAFDAVVLKCLSSTPDIDDSYVCLADEALWRDMQKAIDAESARPRRSTSLWRRVLGQ